MSRINLFDVTAPDWLPEELAPLFERVMQALPCFPDRKTAAAVWSAHVSRQGHRTLERVPLPTRRINGRACFTAREFTEHQFRRLLDSPAIAGGRRDTSEAV